MTCFSTFLWVLTAFKTKPPFTSILYAIWIKKKILPKKLLLQGFFLIFICCWKKTKKIHSLSQQYFFSLKLHKLSIFMLLFTTIYIYFSLKPHKWPFFQSFYYFKGKPSLLRKKYDFTPKLTFLIIFYWFQWFD